MFIGPDALQPNHLQTGWDPLAKVNVKEVCKLAIDTMDRL
jgi:hypothetical protein